MASRPSKVCASCGRRFRWRRRWARCWDSVRYCSAACRRRRLTGTDRVLEHEILRLLGRRGAAASICPSEAARAVAPESWRELMEPARRAARRLAAAGRLVILQRGRPVDPAISRGPIRLKLSATASARTAAR
jgi:hypothetical protein